MHNFSYHRPGDLGKAKAAIKAGEDAMFLAGGMTLLPTMKQRLAAPTDLVDLADIDDLVGIRREGEAIVIKAMTTHAAVTASAEVADAIPALVELVRLVGDPHVRNRGTLGGSIANADPAADYPAALVALGATVKTDSRKIAAQDFFTGMFETALDEGELITEVVFPIPEAAAYRKFPNPASRYAVVGVMVARTRNGIRVAVTGAGPSVFRVPEMEKALEKDFSPEAIADIAVDAGDLNSDIHASAEYRAHLVGVMARRAVAACR